MRILDGLKRPNLMIMQNGIAERIPRNTKTMILEEAYILYAIKSRRICKRSSKIRIVSILQW
jgi:hypothetical protein